MIKFLRKNMTAVAIATALIICASLVAFVLTVMGRFDGQVDDTTSDKATLLTEQCNSAVEETISRYISSAGYAAGLIKDRVDPSSFVSAVGALPYDSNLRSVSAARFCKGGVLYNEHGGAMEATEDVKALIEQASSGKSGAFGSYYDAGKRMNQVAFYAPLDNPNADAVILCYNETLFSMPQIDEKMPDIKATEFAVICDTTGRVVLPIYPENGVKSLIEVGQNVDLLSEIKRSQIPEENQSVLCSRLLGTDTTGTHTETFMAHGERYAFSIIPAGSCPRLAVVTLCSANNLNSVGSANYAYIGAALVIIFVAIFLMVLIIFAVKKISDRRAKAITTRNDELNCLTRRGFEVEAQKTMERFPGSQFAIVATRLKHYRYLQERFPDKISGIVSMIQTHIRTSMELGENYGAGGEGEFILMLHYSDEKMLRNRLNNLSFVVSKNAGTKEYNVRLDFGVYEVEKGTNPATINQIVTNAFHALDADKSNSGISNISMFSAMAKENYMASAEIEVKMEFALKNDEFKVFFQPKIDARTNQIDSCEALVRWYDAEKEFYRPPGMFLPLFEQNGFVVKLDRYVFYKACEFIGLRVSQNLPVFPTSVNISRITALSDGFIEYYTSVKNKFKVPDNFIILEFTESIAAASYDTLNAIATALHQNKFLCSIDDYGSGYSSLNVLKNISVDEIKMDRIFLDKGLSAERDKEILTSIVKLGKRLGIKVVQEGVETAEQLSYVREAGCDVIQGFYFSKPLPMLEYIKFMDDKVAERDSGLMRYGDPDDN